MINVNIETIDILDLYLYTSKDLEGKLIAGLDLEPTNLKFLPPGYYKIDYQWEITGPNRFILYDAYKKKLTYVGDIIDYENGYQAEVFKNYVFVYPTNVKLHQPQIHYWTHIHTSGANSPDWDIDFSKYKPYIWLSAAVAGIFGVSVLYSNFKS